MLSLHTNAASLNIQNKLATTQQNLADSMTRLGTGYRINSAKDDAAGLQIATRLRAQTNGMQVAIRNTQNATSMLQTGDGALDELTNVLQRMKDLATQAADGSSSADDQAAMQSEYDALGVELGNIMNNTSYGSDKLLKGGKLAAAITFQIGATSAETMTFDVSTLMTTADTSLTAVSSNYTTAGTGTELTGGAANATIDKINTALKDVGALRSAIGAGQNRLQHTFNNLSNMTSNTTDATGRIMDTDYAAESANLSSQQILSQASTAMLKQASSMNQMVMSLLQ